MATLNTVFNKKNGIFLALLLTLIVVSELILEHLHLPTWPAFLIMIFFFMAHENIKEAPAILLGSAFGIFNLVLIVYWFGFTVPLLGGNMANYTAPDTVEAMMVSKLIYIAVFVALIVLLKDVIPWVFNNYAFMCFTVAAAVASGNTAAAVAAKTVAGYANKVVAGTDPALIAAMKAATDKAMASTIPVTNVYQWMAIELIGGAILIAGVYGIFKLVAKILGAGAVSTVEKP
ncbi:MAG: hypothetical protein JJE18_08145 [Eubacteriaceae bacterium]|nr:hypothetical protein [Eubacteriaceae bacterium]